MSGVKGPMKKPNGKPTHQRLFVNGNVNYADITETKGNWSVKTEHEKNA